jgi:hypothetical protein
VFETVIVPLPRLRSEAIHGFLSYQIRSLYPAHPDETVFDYQLLGGAHSRRAWVFITRSTALESQRKLGDTLLLPFAVVKGALPRVVRDGGTVVFWHPRWVEVLSITGPANKMEDSSQVIPRRGSSNRDAERVLAALPDEARSIQIVVAGDEIESVRSAFTASTIETPLVFHDFEALCRHGAVRRNALFKPKKAGDGLLRPAVRIQIMLLALLVLGVLLYGKSVNTDLAYARTLETRLKALSSRAAEGAALGARGESLTRELESLQRLKRVDPYRVLSDLTVVLGSEVRIDSLVLEGDYFQIEAEGSRTLELMNRFAGNDRFEKVRLVQIVPAEDSGRERFKLSGSYRAE